MGDSGLKEQEEAWEDSLPGKRPARWFSGTILLLVFYVFSTGPVCRMKEKGMVSKQLVCGVYMPLIMLSSASPSAERFLDWYVDCWTSAQ